jgi:hypothetical protein
MRRRYGAAPLTARAETKLAKEESGKYFAVLVEEALKRR